MEVIFIGRDFYEESHTRMSATYKLENGKIERFCWADIGNALEEGKSFNIRPANDIEMLWAYNELRKIKKE